MTAAITPRLGPSTCWAGGGGRSLARGDASHKADASELPRLRDQLVLTSERARARKHGRTDDDASRAASRRGAASGWRRRRITCDRLRRHGGWPLLGARTARVTAPLWKAPRPLLERSSMTTSATSRSWASARWSRRSRRRRLRAGSRPLEALSPQATAVAAPADRR